MAKKPGGTPAGHVPPGCGDALYPEAVEYVLRQRETSTSALQRAFSIGYARAGRLLDALTHEGIVSAHDGSKSRKVLTHTDEPPPSRKRSIPGAPTISPDALDEKVLKLLQRQSDVPLTYEELANAVDRSPDTVRQTVAQLREAGYAVRTSDAQNGADDVRLTRLCVEEQRFTFPGWGEDTQLLGVISDTHLGSVWAAMEPLEATYDRFAAEGVTRVLHAGDLTDGPGMSSRHPRHREEVQGHCLLPPGMRDWVVEHYPAREGITTYFVSGQHDDWEIRKSGWDLSAAITDKRPDLVHLGYQHADLLVGPEEKTRIRLYHPDGGMAYALSYRTQKWIEAIPGGDKPNLAIMGHLHQYLSMQLRNVHVILPGCFQWQTFYLGGKPAWPQVGGVLLELRLDAGGDIRSAVTEWMPFYAPPTFGTSMREDG